METEKEKTEEKPPQEQPQPAQEQAPPQAATEVPPPSTEQTKNPPRLTKEIKDTSKYIFYFQKIHLIFSHKENI